MLNFDLKSLLYDGASGTPESRIVRVLSERGSVSAGGISRATGLARSTVSIGLAELRRAKVVVEVANQTIARGVGRPASTFALNPACGTCVGLHLGLAEMKLVIADVSHSIIFEQTIALGRDYLPADAAGAGRKAVREAFKSCGLSLRSLLGVGIAVAGPVAGSGRVQRASIVPKWAGVNVRDVFEPAFKREIFADNESNCAAVAEMMWGAAVGCEDFLLFKIDVGIGGAIVFQGRVITGVSGAGGEFGHISIDPAGALCRCGNRGCLELTGSLSAATAAASRLLNRAVPAEELLALANAGDVGSARLIGDIAEVAGRGLGSIGTILNPGLIVIAGRAALAGPILMEPLIRAYERFTLVKCSDVPESERVRIVMGRFVDNGPLMGAVALVLRGRARVASQAINIHGAATATSIGKGRPRLDSTQYPARVRRPGRA